MNAEDIDTCVHDELNFFLGVCNFNLKDLMPAREYFDKQLALDPDHKESLFLRGSCHYGFGEFDKCVADMSKVLWLDETHEKALFQRFLAKKDTRNYEGAEQDLRRLFEINPDYITLTDKEGEKLKVQEVEVDRSNGDVNLKV